MNPLTKTDLYTKVVLTVIAACLLWLCVNNVTFVPAAQAQGAIALPGQVTIVEVAKNVVMPVAITGITNGVEKPGNAALPIKATAALPVKVTGVEKDPKNKWDALKVDDTAKP